MNKNKISPRYTIGIIIDWIENHYQINLLSSIENATKRKNINLITYVGGAYKSPRAHELPCNLIYNFVDKKRVDGLLISTGTVGHFCTNDDLLEFFNKFDPLPIVSIAQKIKPFHSVLTDNTIGLKNILHHLINDHGYKKIAFIQGPPTNQEAVERFNVYRDMLNQYGLDFDLALVVCGDFTPLSGREAVRTLIDERKSVFDAVVASNDDMAFGALVALQERNIFVPNDVALTGFDDMEICKYINPSLTTVKLPIYEQGEKAVDLLISLINGDKTERDIYLPAESVIRESCGCLLKPVWEETVKNSGIILEKIIKIQKGILPILF
jgi:DNA-binding LacI/PurR family transcriptional regulator